MKNTWRLLNELSSENTGKTNIVSELNFNNQEITAPMGMAEAFFSSVGDNLAASTPNPVHDPSFYLEETDKTFSLKIPTVETVYKLLNGINEKKSCWVGQYA